MVLRFGVNELKFGGGSTPGRIQEFLHRDVLFAPSHLMMIQYHFMNPWDGSSPGEDGTGEDQVPVLPRGRRRKRRRME